MGTLTFAPGATARTIGVAVSDDALDEADEEFKVTLSGPWNGTLSGKVAQLSVTGQITDDDATPVASLELTPAEIGEAGGESRVTAQLSGASSKATTVTVSVAASTAYAVSVNRVLSIAAGQTASVGTVTVTAVADEVDTEHRSVTVSGTAANTLGVTGPVSQELTIRDDDERGLEVSPEALTVSEGGTGSYTVALSTQPTGAVTVAVGGTKDADLSVDEAGLTFSTTNWATAQTVTVRAGEDDDAVQDRATLTHTATGADYGTVSRDLPVTVTDNDTAALVLSKSVRLGVTEGGSGSYTVKLATQPTGVVTVAVGGTADTDLSVDEARLTFGTTSWATAQTVTVSAGEDDDAVQDRATLTHTCNGRGLRDGEQVTCR